MPNHLLSLADWESLPEDEFLRLELVEGVLVASAPRRSWHQHAVTQLAYRLDEQLPADLGALPSSEVLVSGRPLTIRVPDVHVTDEQLIAANPRRIPATRVVLAGTAVLAVAGHPVTLDLNALVRR